MLRKVVTTNTSSAGYGATHKGRIVNGMWANELCSDHKIFGALYSMEGSETFSAPSPEASYAGTLQQYHGCSTRQSPRRVALPQASCTSSHAFSVEQAALFVVTCNQCPGHLEQGCRPHVEGQPTLQRLAPPPASSGLIVGEIRQAAIDLFTSCKNTHCPMVFLAKGQGHTPQRGCTGPSMAQHAALCIPPPIAPTIARVRVQGMTLILVVPRQPKAPWLPEII